MSRPQKSGLGVVITFTILFITKLYSIIIMLPSVDFMDENFLIVGGGKGDKFEY